MKNPIAGSRKTAALFGVIALALTLIGAALRIINIYSNFEISVGYYSPALLVDVMHVFFALSVLAIGGVAFALAKKTALETVEDEKDPTLKVVLCFLAIAALVYVLAKTYFDVYVAMNSPNKILLHMACLAAMFFFAALARVYLGSLRDRSYLFFTATAAFLCGVYSIPSIFFCIISKIYREYTYLIFYIIILAVFAFATYKLISLMIAKKPTVVEYPAEEIDAIFESADDSTDNADTHDNPEETDSAPENTESE